MLAHNIKTFFTHPEVRKSLRLYWGSRVLNRGMPKLQMQGLTLSDFQNFTEFHSTRVGFDQEESRFFNGYDFRQGSFIDVGANYGLISMILARRWPDRDVYAFEPNSVVRTAFKKNLEANAITNIKVEGCAVGNLCGTAGFLSLAKGSARSSFSVASSSEKVIDVPVTTLDSYASEHRISLIGLLKVDVEGYESGVFQGAESLLKNKTIRVIHFEVCPGLTRLAGYNAQLPGEILRKHGYQLQRLVGGDLIPASVEDMLSVDWENWVATCTLS